MKIYNHADLLSALAASTGKFCLYISFAPNEAEVEKAAPYLFDDERFLKQEFVDVYYDGFCYMTFDSEEEMQRLYNMTVGDDGPTKLNPYNGKARVYALTAAPDGRLLNENT